MPRARRCCTADGCGFDRRNGYAEHRHDQLSKTFTLPLNVERAYLDVFAQSQSGDEFWYTCAPNDVAAELQNCGNTAFREAEVSIDGKPAGVSPVYPWIYTGGIDPYLGDQWWVSKP